MKLQLSIFSIFVLVLLSAAVHAGTIVVPVGGDVAAALNSANCGDTVITQAAASYPVNVTLSKPCTVDIIIQSSRAAELPIGARVNPSQSALMTKFVSVVPAEPVIKTAAGASHYKFIGIEFMTANQDLVVYDLIRFGEGRDLQKTLESVPHHFTLDRCYVHGWPTQDVQRGVNLNSAETSIINSYISDIHMVGIEAQAIAGWNGPGPFHVVNNYLEGSTQNILFGGADPGISNMVPSDIEIRHNYMFKPMSWKVGDPTYAGKHWTIKNILELKNARRVVIDGNVFENNWTDGQSGIPILFTARNQEGTCTWCMVEQVSFTNNSVINAEGGVHILRTDAESKGALTRDIAISNNLFDRITGSGAFVLINNPTGIKVVHNTIFKSRNAVTMDARTALNGGPDPKGTGLVFQDNLFSEGDYGIFGSGVGEGAGALNVYFTNYVFSGNNMAGRASSDYPAANTFLPTSQLGFVNLAGGNYRLSATSPLKNKGTDGTDVGADIDALNAAQSGSVVSLPNPSPTPSVSPSPTATPTPVPSPTPIPSPVPSPTPSPTPQPTPTPSACTMLVSDVTMPQWSSGKLVVNISGFNSPATVSATQTSGQVMVDWPTTRTISGSSVIIEFGLETKKKSSSVTVSGPCGSKTVMVNVQ